MKTIEVNDEMYNFLMDLSEELNEQDHRATRMPYFFQVKTRHQIAVPEGNGIQAWFYDGNLIETEEDIKQAVQESLDHADSDRTYEVLSDRDKEFILESKGYSKVYYDYEDRFENAFFTSKACDAHIKANRHNLTDPVNYLSHAHRNPEMEKLMQFLCGLTGGKLHE